MTRNVVVTQFIAVTVDESKFTEEFMAEFRQSFYPFEDIDDHLKHLAQLNARGIYDEGDFIEGYGPTSEFGISFRVIEQDEEIEE